MVGEDDFLEAAYEDRHGDPYAGTDYGDDEDYEYAVNYCEEEEAD